MAYKDVKEKIENLPQRPGVYIMKDKKGEVLYIGKATFLKKRVKNHFSSASKDLFLKKVSDLEYIGCDTEEQALLLEASLIKERKPKYNVALRDDKSYPYVEITQEEFSRVFISRPKKKTMGSLFGPYPKVKILKNALNLIRKIFPYRSCAKLPKKECLYFHLNLCPGPCIGKISVSQYKETIEDISKILRGERKELLEDLEEKMNKFSKNLKFEEAAQIRDKILSVYNLYWGKRESNQLFSLKEILDLPVLPLIIEAIDISSLRGRNSSGSVVVFREGVPDKSSYRRFRIRNAEGTDDYAMIKEVARRRYSRLLRENKRMPDLLIIDGGKGHVNKVKEELKNLGLSFSVIGIAKKNEEIWFPYQEKPLIIPKESDALHLLQRIRDEAHRFAHSYHLLRRKKEMIR
ncbi:MAG TPA: excinuclease ABC subunit UvrC [Candidatus Omnitrophica bacterium]|nr:excinuclease ABC subunit UvrC [Candidatus Omnitrophota bacterium]